MPRHIILCVGSRGDVEPFAALAAALHARCGTPPIACVPKDYTHLLSPSCETHALPFDTADIMRCFAAPPPADTPAHLAMWCGLGRAIDELLLPQTPAVLAAARAGAGVDGVVVSYLMRPLGLILAHALAVPLTVVQLQPQVPTAHFPHHVQPKVTAATIIGREPPKDEYLQTYVGLERLLYTIFSEKMNALRKQLDLPALIFDDMLELSKGDAPSVLIANAFPLALIPNVPADYGPAVYHVGPLADSYVQSSKTADETAMEDAVGAFLAAGEAPACVGLGSMPASPGVCRRIMHALKEAGVERAIFVGGASGLGADTVPLNSAGGDELDELRQWIDASTMSVTSIPYPWLLPQCSMMVCHGGAGVVSSTLRAGIPVVVTPMLFDQFLWGLLVEERGFGVCVGPSMEEASHSTMVTAIKRARGCELRDKCASVGKRLQKDPAGVTKMVDLLTMAI